MCELYAMIFGLAIIQSDIQNFSDYGNNFFCFVCNLMADKIINLRDVLLTS